MKKKTLIVDAANMCARFTHSYALSTSRGKKSGVLYGVLKFLYRFLKLEDGYRYKRVVFAFDDGWGFREKLYPDYKGQRTKQRKSNPEFYPMYQNQTARIKKILPKLGIITAVIPGWEGDDCIYKIIRAMLEKDNEEEFVIYSNDKDFLHIASDKIIIAKPVKFQTTREQFVWKRDKGLLIKRAIIGDVSDNIKGIHQIGEVKSNIIIKEIKENRLRAFLDNIEKSEKFAEKLKENKSILIRNYKLMCLRYAYNHYTKDKEGFFVKPEFSMKNLKCILDKYEIKSFMGELYYFKSILGKLKRTLPKKQFKKIKRFK